MITTCNVLWSLGIMDGCVFNREDIPGSCFGRRILPCDRSTISELGKGKEKYAQSFWGDPAPSILANFKFWMPTFSLQYLLNFSTAIYCVLWQFYLELWAYFSPGFQTQYIFIHLKSSCRHLAFWTVYFRVFFFSWSLHFYMGPFLQIKHLNALGLLSPQIKQYFGSYSFNHLELSPEHHSRWNSEFSSLGPKTAVW